MTAVGYTSGDERKLDKAGGTMTGDLVLASDPTDDLGAATKQYVDASAGGGGGGSTADATTTTKGIVQLAGDLAGTAASPTVPGLTGKLSTGGGTLTGALTLAGSPTTALHAATKAYVDGLVSSAIHVPAPTGSAASDTSNIQSALDSANSAGQGLVQLKAGTYLIQAPGTASLGGVRVYSNTILAGQGMGVTTLKVVNATTADITGIVRTPTGVVTKYATVRDLTIDGNKANKSGTPTIIGFYAGVTPLATTTDEDIVCERVEIKNCTDYGFDPHERVTRLRFTDCLAHDNDQDGFTLDGVYDFLLEGCTSYSNGRHGFNFVTGTARGEVTGCRALSNTTNGYTLQNGAKFVELTNCRAESSGGSGFVLNGVAQVSPQLDLTVGGFHVLNGCRSRTANLHGFQLVGAKSVQLIGCRSTDCSQTTTNTSSHYRIAESGTDYSTDTTLIGCTWYQTSGVTNTAKYGIDEQSTNDGTTYAIGCHGAGTATADLHLLNTNSSLYSAHNGTAGGHQATSAYTTDTPGRHGLVEWNYDPIAISGASSAVSTLTTNVPTLMKFTAQTGGTVANIVAQVVVAGSSLTSGQNFAALYDSTGTRIGVTADQTTAWGSTGLKTMALTSSTTVTVGADYYVMLLSNGTTPPKFAQGATSAQSANAGLSGASLRFSTNGTGTTTPSSFTPSGNSGTNSVLCWVALS